MHTFKASVLALAATVIAATAQNTTSSGPATSQVQVQTANQYSGASVVGYHVGAALSYMVARAPGSGNSFTYNSSAASDQLLNNDIAAGIPLPCYVVKVSQISNNSGPLECGAGDQPGYYDVARLAASDGAASQVITFEGIRAWYVCAVQSFTYGWVQATVVGSYTSDEPSGPGIQNCTSVDSLVLTGNSTASGDDGEENGAASTTALSASTAAVTTTAKSSGPASSTACSACYSLTTIVTRVCPSSTAGTNTTLHASSTATSTVVGPIATFTGTASSLGLSHLATLIVAVAVAIILL